MVLALKTKKRAGVCLAGLWIVKILWVVKELAHNKGNLIQQRELQY